MQNQCKKPQLSRRNKHKVDRYDTRHVIKGKTGVKGWILSPLGWSKILLRFKDNTWNVTFVISTRSGSRIFSRRGCTRLLLYFNTNKPHSFFLQNTSCIRKPQGISGGGGGGVRTPCTLPLDPPLSTQVIAQGYVPENKESRRTNYCKEALMITTVLFVIWTLIWLSFLE